MALLDYQTLIDNMVRDDATVTDSTDRDDAINLAVIRYNTDRPDKKVEDVVSVGGQFLSLPANWETNFSVLKSIEFPIGNVPTTFLESGAYGIYNAPGLDQVMVLGSLAASDTVRMTYSIAHLVNGVSDTPPVAHREAIASWAASILCEQLASYYSGDSDSTISADSVDHNSKARLFANRAKGFRKAYHDQLGIDPKRNVAAGVVVDLDMADSQGRDRLLHSRRFR